MNWLTEKQVKAAAKKSHNAAVRCSQEHWWQLSTATRKEIDEAPDDWEVLVCASYCALCQRYFLCKCKGCPLDPQDDGPRDCCQEWRDMDRVFFGRHPIWPLWRRAAKAMYKRLMQVPCVGKDKR